MKSRTSIKGNIFRIINTLLLCLCANCCLIIRQSGKMFLIPIFIAVYILLNIIPSLSRGKLPSRRIRLCYHGAECLKYFLVSTAVSAAVHIIAAFRMIPDDWGFWAVSLIVCIIAEAIFF